MPQEITYKDPLNLALRDDVQAAVAGLRLVRAAVVEELAIVIDGGAFDQGAFFVHFRGEAPC
jgi:hypothetical protein